MNRMNIDDAADGAETTPADEPMPSARSRLKKTTARSAAAADDGDDAGENAAPAGIYIYYFHYDHSLHKNTLNSHILG